MTISDFQISFISVEEYFTRSWTYRWAYISDEDAVNGNTLFAVGNTE